MPKIPNGNNNNSNSLVKEENIDRPFQFETMMKELNEQERDKVKFTCTQLDDEDNSNETDLILNQKNNNKVPIQQYHNMYHANSLPSIDSITSQQQQQMQHHQATAINNNNNQHIEMDWNDTDFLKLFESDHLFNSNHANGNSNVYSNQTQSSFIINNNLKQNANNNFNEDSSILNFELNHQYNNGTKIIDSSLKTCIFNENDNNNVNMINNNINNHNHHQAMNNNTNNNANTNTNNNNNMMMPWEFNDDFNQIASYMQSPTV
jgi:hypothetical protein